MQVESVRPLKVTPLGEETLVVNRGSTLSYKNTGTSSEGEAVSTSNRDGTLALNAELVIRAPTWFIANAGKSELEVKRSTPAGERYGVGEEQTVFTPNPGSQIIALSKGSANNPDTVYGPLIHVSRDLSIKESQFSGDGAAGLASIYGVTRVVAASEGQGVGVFGGAVTEGTHAGSSLADGIGLYGVGRSTSVSTRTGMGVFANGRRENASGVATGMEVTCDNETLSNGTYNAGGASSTKVIFAHATGTANVGCGLQLGKPGTATMVVGIGVNEGAVTAASFRDDSEAERSVLIKGKHAKAGIALAAEANGIVIGAETTSNEAPILEFANVAAAPETNPAAGFLYVEGGTLKYRSSAGNVRTVAAV